MSTSTVPVHTEPPYSVHVGPGLLGEVAGGTGDPDRVFVLADERAAGLYADRLGELEAAPRLELAGGEATKSLARLGQVLDSLAGAGLSRRSCLVTLGGGVIADLGGLAASLYKRGIAVVHAPTTLLAQVDASVGGKTAINLAAGKNLAGSFHQPRAVFADTATLASLDEADWLSGLGEAVKTALIGGEELLGVIESKAEALLARDAAALARLVAACVAVKAGVVAGDPTELGPRRALNLGHTFAHAIEHAAGYGRIPHGVAVATGIGLALDASLALERLEEPDLAARVRALLERLGLPADLASLRARYQVDLERGALVEGLTHDKKGRVGRAQLVLLRRPGELELGVEADDALLRELLA